jgi:protein-S-isoprenylcysteine O-methyltransferase Ste14
MPAGADNPGVVVRPPLIYLGAFLIVLVCRRFWPMPIDAEGRVLWPGVALVALAIGIAIWGRRTMAAAGTNINPALPAKTIVSSGPFRFSRNPLYLSLTLMYLGLTVAVNTWWGFVVLIPLVIVMHAGVVLREERYLEKKFGEPYRQYRARVRRYL